MCTSFMLYAHDCDAMRHSACARPPRVNAAREHVAAPFDSSASVAPRGRGVAQPRENSSRLVRPPWGGGSARGIA